MIDYNKFVFNSRKWLKEYISNNHLQSLVIGVSGGIDSTVSCAIAYPVCYELDIPLIGRSLPTSTNENCETTTAQLVGKAFCSDFKEVLINCDDIIHEFELCEGKMTALQKGNIKARYRMMYLRNLASIHRGVVLDNDNFTEWNTGFWTVGGDSPMDINLGLHYLWKTEIYELANYLLYSFEVLSVRNEVIIKAIEALHMSILLTPTDGNGVATGGDCGQFGLDNYKQVDDVLKTMYYQTGSPMKSEKDEYIRLIDSYNEQGVDKVMVLHQNTEYKRKPAPIMPTPEGLELENTYDSF